MLRYIIGLAALACLALAYQDEPNFKKGYSVFLKSGKVGDDPTCPSQLYSCSDCSTSRLCVPQADGSWHHIQDVPCADPTPYCNKQTGSCTAKPDSDCGVKDDFICTKDGYFPDPKNCSIYHVCKGYVVNTFQCINRVFDPVTSSCVTSTAPCTPVDCTNASGRKVAHTLNDNYFAYCFNGGVTLMDRCEGKYVFNVTSQLCQPPCKADGAVASNDDCTKYYTCTMVTYLEGVTVPYLSINSCPAGMAFDPVHLVCDAMANVPSCKPPTPPTATPTLPPTVVPTSTVP